MADPRDEALRAAQAAYDAYTLSKETSARLRKNFVTAARSAIALRATQSEIGDLIHLSRQRVSQLLREDED